MLNIINNLVITNHAYNLNCYIHILKFKASGNKTSDTNF